MNQNRKKYNTAFKLEAIRLVTEGDRNISEVEGNLDISKGTLARWIREGKPDPGETFPGSCFFNAS